MRIVTSTAFAAGCCFATFLPCCSTAVPGLPGHAKRQLLRSDAEPTPSASWPVAVHGAGASLLQHGQSTERERRTAGASATGQAAGGKSPSAACEKALHPESAFASYIFKVAAPGMLCEGPGAWSPITAQTCPGEIPNGDCRSLCQAAMCFLQDWLCGQDGCLDEAFRVDGVNWPHEPHGCYFNIGEKAARWNTHVGSLSANSKTFCFVQSVGLGQGYSPLTTHRRSFCVLQRYSTRRPVDRLDLGKGLDLRSCASGLRAHGYRYMEYSEEACIGLQECPFQNPDATQNERTYVLMTPQVLRLSHCGGTGRFGPTQSMCDDAYVPALVQVIAGYQIYRVTLSGKYRYEAAGARGGMHTLEGLGGYGTVVKGELNLQKNDRLIVVVGQQGNDNYAGGNWGGGGGGATFVAKARGREKVKKLAFFADLIAVAGGGSGLDSRQNLGQAGGGRGVQSSNSTQGAGGEKSGGGGGFEFQGVGGGSYAGSFLSGAEGGGTKQHYGGFGGGGGPFNGGGGGGGMLGGDCLIGGRDNACFGGSSIGGHTVLPNTHPGHGYFTLALVRRHGGDEASEDEEHEGFESGLNREEFRSYNAIDFDLGCTSPDKNMHCLEDVDLTSKYKELGVSFPEATTLFLADSDRRFCARKGKPGQLGNEGMTMEFKSLISRVGFYIYVGNLTARRQTFERVTLRVYGASGQSNEYNVNVGSATELMELSKAGEFIGIKGVGIRKVTVSAAHYCVDSLRWLATDGGLEAGLVDFSEVFEKDKDVDLARWNFTSVYETTAPNGVAFTVQGWTSILRYTNGFGCEACRSRMSLKATNLVPRWPYKFTSWNFRQTGVSYGQGASRWSISANGRLVANGRTSVCKYYGDLGATGYVPGLWLSSCSPDAAGTVTSNDDGEIEFSWSYLNGGEDGDGLISLSAFALQDAGEFATVTTTSTASVGLSLDEAKCEDFSTAGWSSVEASKSDDGDLHGPFRSDQVMKTFQGLPPHDTLAIQLRVWAEKWARNQEPLEEGQDSLWVEVDGRRFWTKELPEEGAACVKSLPPWRKFSGTMPSKLNCYANVAVGKRASESSAVSIKIGHTSSGSPTYGFGKLHLLAGRTTKQIRDLFWMQTGNPDLPKGEAMDYFPILGGVPALSVLKRLPRHDFLRLDMRLVIPKKAKPRGLTVITIDDLEVFSEALQHGSWCARNSRTRVPMCRNEECCIIEFSTALPHSKSHATMTISSWKFLNPNHRLHIEKPLVSIGSEAERCSASVCREGWALKDGPPWCAGKCSVASCCYMLGTCHRGTCPASEGLLPKAYGVPNFCRGSSCTQDECCQPKGRCTSDLCGFGFKVKDYLPETCEQETCSTEECCDRQGTCASKGCRPGYISLGGNILCRHPECSMFECCRQLGRCTGDVCNASLGLMASEMPTEYCADSKCTVPECCTTLGTCSIDVCHRGSRLKHALYLPSFCRGPKCHTWECCEPLGMCSPAVCPAGWGLKEDRPEICAGQKCRKAECCELLGLCVDLPCPYGFKDIPGTRRNFTCSTPTCEVAECCESLEVVKADATSTVSIAEESPTLGMLVAPLTWWPRRHFSDQGEDSSDDAGNADAASLEGTDHPGTSSRARSTGIVLVACSLLGGVPYRV
eukprot:TRINITY_DN17238_c0_g1_i5.p1 TRINITY_DN17238_c0_g1~~TRINITY_DN17238_c0_g1_i5.p1  ORF type:complete len:1623 (-),score=243.95 TRINITY_DN17238_c0_g1_i5:15-4883(-)